MNVEWIKHMSVYQGIKLVALMLSGALILFLIIGAVWVATLPPAPILLPSPQSLQATAVILSSNDPSSYYLEELPEGSSGVEANHSGSEGPPPGASIMAARPLFWEGRRPVVIIDNVTEIKEQVSAVSPSELDSVILVGIYFAGDASGAIVRVNGQRMRVPLGDSLLGWKLELVDATEIQFSNAGQEKTIRLEHVGASD